MPDKIHYQLFANQVFDSSLVIGQILVKSRLRNCTHQKISIIYDSYC